MTKYKKRSDGRYTIQAGRQTEQHIPVCKDGKGAERENP